MIATATTCKATEETKPRAWLNFTPSVGNRDGGIPRDFTQTGERRMAISLCQLPYRDSHRISKRGRVRMNVGVEELFQLRWEHTLCQKGTRKEMGKLPIFCIHLQTYR
jgi:hypothetical protein